MRFQYPYQPAQWATTPIRIVTNPYTGLLDGNDGKNAADLVLSPGYRETPDLDSPEPVVSIGDYMFCTPDYDGVDMFGIKIPSRILPGGVKGGKMLLRKGMADGFRFLNGLLNSAFGGAFEYQGIDAYRSTVRSAALFSRKAGEIANENGVDLKHCTDVELLVYGRAADVTCAWVRIVENGMYHAVANELSRDAKFKRLIQEAIDGGGLKGTLAEALADYIIISANTNLGRTANRGVRLNAHKNAHPGCGAYDVVVRGKLRGKVVPLAYLPFDFAHPFCSMTFLEDPANFDRYVKLAKENAELAAHLVKLGIPTPDEFTRSDWDALLVGQRILSHSILSAGGSFYDPGDPTEAGEFWHWQLGLTVYDVRTGQPADGVAETHFSRDYPNSGNTCHTLLRVPAGPKRIAVRTGNSAFALVEKQYGHEA